MLRHALKAMLVVAALGSLFPEAHASGHRRRNAAPGQGIGGYGPGPFGRGDFIYNGFPTTNFQAKTRVRHH